MNSRAQLIDNELQRRRTERETVARREVQSPILPFMDGKAFLGYMEKRNTVDCKVEANRLVITVKWWNYAQLAIFGVLIGPVGTAVIAAGGVTTRKWYLWAIILAVNVAGWAALIEAIRVRRVVVFDFVQKLGEFYRRRTGPPFYSFDLQKVQRVVTEGFFRPLRAQIGSFERFDDPAVYQGATVKCFTLAVATADSVITVVETTDPQVVESVCAVLSSRLDLPHVHTGSQLNDSM